MKLLRWPSIQTWLSNGVMRRVYLHEPYPYPDLMPTLLKVLEAFGPERVMWASDHTQSKNHHSWAESLYYLRDSSELSASDKEWLLGRSVRTILKWSKPATHLISKLKTPQRANELACSNE